MLFSVIVPVFNAVATLDRCISSVLHQTYTIFELILVDDGSLDNSLQICSGYAKRDGRVIVMHQPNKGHTAARLTGLAAARGDYVLFLDSDDWFERDLLMTGAMAIDEKHCELVLFGHRIRLENANIDVPLSFATGFYNSIAQSPLRSQLIMDENGESISRALWGKIYAQKLIQKWLPLVPKEILTGEDMCCFLGCAKEAKGVIVMNGIYYNYRISGGTISRRGDPTALERCRYTARFLAHYINCNDPQIQSAINRLIIQQMYSALMRELLSGKQLIQVRCDLIKLSLYAACRQAIYNFSSTSARLRAKHYLIKHNMVVTTKLICLLRKKETLF